MSFWRVPTNKTHEFSAEKIVVIFFSHHLTRRFPETWTHPRYKRSRSGIVFFFILNFTGTLVLAHGTPIFGPSIAPPLPYEKTSTCRLRSLRSPSYQQNFTKKLTNARRLDCTRSNLESFVRVKQRRAYQFNLKVATQLAEPRKFSEANKLAGPTDVS